MAATLLNTPRTVEVSVYVVRAFVQLRDLLSSNKELARQLKTLEQRIERKLATHDQANQQAELTSEMAGAAPAKAAV